MINRENYQLARRYMEYRDKVLQNDANTVQTYWQSLKHLLQWAGNRTFRDASKILPTFPEYLLTARNKQQPVYIADENKPLTPGYMKKKLSHARAFFEWARLHEPGYSTAVSEAWTKTLQVRRSAGTQTRLRTRVYWTLEDVQKIAALAPGSLRERRDIAAACFMFISGIRIGAFTTLSLDCVDIGRRRVSQLPEMGVQTKNSKAAVTFLLAIPGLFPVVAAWDEFMHSQAGGAYCWYPPINHDGDRVLPGLLTGSYTGRVSAFVGGLKLLCERAGVPYKSPHKIRHGFGVYGVKIAKDMKELKAISQNLMHSNVGITDGIYGKLGEDDLSDILSNLGV